MRECFRSAWARLSETCPDPRLNPEQLNAIGHALLRQLRAPAEEWGFDQDLLRDPNRQEDYAVAMLHALWLGMVDPGQGDPISRLKSRSPKRRNRHPPNQEKSHAEET